MIISKLRMILTKDELRRIAVQSEQNGTISITADVHGMKCFEAKRFINNIINIVHITFQLVIIHGYNHGTAIKEMLTHHFINNHICRQFIDPNNQGVTHMIIAV